eukprot:COSAG01_NODE_4148_length_5295_cov_7.400115_3_plen_80_part_00
MRWYRTVGWCADVQMVGAFLACARRGGSVGAAEGCVLEADRRRRHRCRAAPLLLLLPPPLLLLGGKWSTEFATRNKSRS